MSELLADMYNTMANRLRQYARVAISRVVGTCLNTDGHYLQLLAMEENRLLLRAELTAVQKLLISKGICTVEDLQKAATDEMDALLTMLAEQWPEVTVDPLGTSYTLNLPKFAERVKRERWPR